MDDGIPGVDAGDLDSTLDRIASECADENERADDQLHVRRGYTAPFCEHLKARIDESDRSLVCRGCGARLDPFDFLARLTRNVEQWVTARKDAERRAHKVEVKLQELLREERNARSRLRNLRRKERHP